MGYKPQTVKSDFGGPSGKANIKVQRDENKTIIRVKVSFDETGDSFIIPASDCSEEVRSYLQSGEFNVRLGKDGKSITSISPWSGMYKVHTKKFVAQRDKPPVPQTRTGTNEGGQKWSYQYFVPLLEVVEGECKGMQIPYFLRYFFDGVMEDVPGKGKVLVAALAHPKSPYYGQLAEYCEVSGVWEAGPMPMEDNLLPRMEKRILRQDRIFTVIIKKGFVDNIYEESNTKPTNEPLPTDDDDLSALDEKEVTQEATNSEFE